MANYNTNITYANTKLGLYTVSDEECPQESATLEVPPRYCNYYSGTIKTKYSTGVLTATLQYCSYTPGQELEEWKNIEIFRITKNLVTGQNIELDLSSYSDITSSGNYVAWQIKVNYSNGSNININRVFPAEFNPATQPVNSYYIYTPNLLELSIGTERYQVPGSISAGCCKNLYIQFLKIGPTSQPSNPDQVDTIAIRCDNPFGTLPEWSTTDELYRNDNKVYERHYFQFNGQGDDRIGNIRGSTLIIYKPITINGINSTWVSHHPDFEFYSAPKLSTIVPFKWLVDTGVLDYKIFDVGPSADLYIPFDKTVDNYALNTGSDAGVLILKYQDYTKNINCTIQSSGGIKVYHAIIDSPLFAFEDTSETLKFPNWVGTYPISTAIQLQNQFGDTFILGGQEITTFNFNKAPDPPIITSLSWAPSQSGPWAPLNSDKKAVEGIYLKINTRFNLYSKAFPKTQLFLTRGSAQISMVQEYTSYSTPISYAVSSNPGQTDIALLYGPIRELSTSDTRAWKIRNITTVGDATSISPYNMQVAPLTNPDINFINCTISNDIYTLQYSKNALNGADKLSLYLVDDNHSDIIGPFDTSLSLGETTATVATDIWSNVINLNLRIKAVSSVTPDNNAVTIASKEFYTNLINKIKDVPTVAYRPHQLGINTSTVATDATIDIHTYSSKPYIYINNAEGDKYFKFDTTNGMIIWHTGGSEYNFLNSSK